MSTFDLFSSVRDGNTDIVRRLLQSKLCRARLNDRNEWGDTALHLAAEAGNGEICQMLTAAGASVTVRNNRGETCLHRAAVGGHVEAVSAIVGRDQDPEEAVNSQNDAGYTALHHAAKHGSKELIDILVKAGADQMIENNAGETPYMVAHKYQQWDAERLLLNVEQQHADKAIREMNRKEKNIVRGYLNAVKYASQLESRIRVMLVGDTGSGKSSLKKTLSGEPYDPMEKPTTGINADASVTRVTFKQFREWVQQPSSKADTHRLNLEYIDVIIDYILYFVKQPQIVSDEHLDPNALQIEKERAKTVQFNPDDDIILPSDVEESLSCSEGSGGGASEGEPESDGVGKSVDHESSLDESGSSGGGGVSSPPAGVVGVACANDVYMDDNDAASAIRPEITEEPDSAISYLDKEEGEYFASAGSVEDCDDDDSDFNMDDRLHRLAEGSSYDTPSSLLDTSPGGSRNDPRQLRGAGGTGVASTNPTSNSEGVQSVQGSSSTQGSATATATTAAPEEEGPSSTEKVMDCTSALIYTQTRRELSRLLIEKLPMEILKRMVIRWPVGEEHHIDRSSLNAKRLAMTIWDPSGDPVQANFIPFFFSDRCIFVATYNLCQDLDDPCTSHCAKNLVNIDGTTPTNAQVLEAWLGAAAAFTKHTPSEPFRCKEKTPLLPPVILACTHSDDPSLEDNPAMFYKFFDRASFPSYNKHLVEAKCPSAVRLSNCYETQSNRCETDEDDEPYSGHHILRREIEYLARQLPYVQDNVPVQWVKFEQLMYGLQQQKKLLLLYDDLAKYIAEHCNLNGTLCILPALSHFHDLGVIVHFYRHPELFGLVITRPQWLVSALGSIITSNPSRWVTAEVQNGFKRLGMKGWIEKMNLQLAYRCARMGQKYWNEMLFILNCMDLITCHTSLHASKSVYVPSMVTQPAPSPHCTPTSGDPLPVYLNTAEGSVFPIALFNQLLVRCTRSSHYNPVFYYRQAHFRLNATHHLLIWLEHSCIAILLQAGADKFCTDCSEKSATQYSFERECSNVEHLLGEDVEFMPTDNMTTLIRNSSTSGVIDGYHLAFPDDLTPAQLCPAVLGFVMEHLQFLCNCWFPGLEVELASRGAGVGEGEVTVLDQSWKYNVLQEGRADKRLEVWFPQEQ